MSKTLSIAFSIALMGAASLSQAFTLATAADPTSCYPGSGMFFTGYNEISGEWTGSGLNLIIPKTGMTYENVSFKMDSVFQSGSQGEYGPGSLTFYTDCTDNLLTFSWDKSYVYAPFGFGASDFTAGATPKFSNVSVHGDAVSDLGELTNVQFAFSFANPYNGGDYNSYSAAFTSSAEAVPEPASLALIAAGVAAVASRRRKSA